MAGPVILELPTPPSVNAAYANRKGGKGRGRYKTALYKAWLECADAFLLQQKRALNGRIPVTGECELSIRLPANVRGDASNRIKVCEDYLVSRGITGDDKHNRKVSIERDASLDGHCVVTVTSVEGE